MKKHANRLKENEMAVAMSSIKLNLIENLLQTNLFVQIQMKRVFHPLKSELFML